MTDRLPDGITAAAASLRDGTLTATELVELAIARADAVDPILGAYITRFDADARAAAAQADRELANGEDRGALHGMPIAIKDILTTREGPTTGQSAAQDPDAAGREDAVVVARLREAGAVITGKTTLSEYACGFPDPEKPFPVPRNPWDLDRWAGGSSAGSASAVSAGLVLGAIGTDTGGSVRIPAGFCGVTGLKTTWGAIDTRGCLPLAWSFDSIGPIARSAADCRIVLDAIDGSPTQRPEETRSVRGLRVGVDRLDAVTAATDPGQVGAHEQSLSVLADAGAEIVELPLPRYAEIVAANYVIMLSEGLAYHLPGLRERWHDYGRSTRQLLCGGFAYSGADYVQAQRIRAQSWREAAGLRRGRRPSQSDGNHRCAHADGPARGRPGQGVRVAAHALLGDGRLPDSGAASRPYRRRPSALHPARWAAVRGPGRPRSRLGIPRADRLPPAAAAAVNCTSPSRQGVRCPRFR